MRPARSYRPVAVLPTAMLLGLLVAPAFPADRLELASLYPEDHRRAMRASDYVRFPGAGVLYCQDANDVPQEAAAAWLVGSPRLVMMNAHNFLDRHGASVRDVGGCFFQIGGRNYDFDAKSVRLGVARGTPLHITDDWALIRLRSPVDPKSPPQPLPKPSTLQTGSRSIPVTMVSPAGHANFRMATTSLEDCHIIAIDPPSEDGMRRARHDCNDGFGGSGSGLFDGAGRLVAMHSASLDMDRRLPFEIDLHYGSALVIEGSLLDAIQDMARE